jgi:arylsulfatase A-like enzyme
VLVWSGFVLLAITRLRRSIGAISLRLAIWLLVPALLLAGFLFVQRYRERQQVASLRVQGANVVLLLFDALRPDHMPCYGYKLDTTPFLCEMASQGFVFDRAISQSSWTKPSVGSLFTSVYPHSHKATGYLDVLSRQFTTLAEMLAENGYHTVGLQANPIIMPEHNFDQGFSEYLKFGAWDKAGKLVDAFINRVQIDRKHKFFAYFHFMDPHLPYDPPAEHRRVFDQGYDGKLGRIGYEQLWHARSGLLKLSDRDRRHFVAMYDAELHYLDSQVRRLYAHLARRGLVDNTIFVLLADHGEEFWDHGDLEHGHTMYNELLRVPLVIVHPRWQGGQVRVSQLVRLIDVMPTLAGLVQVPTPPLAMGVDLTEAMVTGRQLDLVAFSEANLHGLAVEAIQKDASKVIKAPISTLARLYNLSSDPAEKNGTELMTRHHDLLRLLEEHRARRIQLAIKPEQKALDDETKEALRSLGYIN